ncbi:MAG: hypothetical protein IIA49_06455 [Bacteroidetes bacterium]|nr:hypothetical protein [Bacteroidota bacterium]
MRVHLWRRGVWGYRLHAKVAGNPDIVFIKKKIAIFIDGCFWHKCPKCFRKPKSNQDYWEPKIQRKGWMQGLMTILKSRLIRLNCLHGSNRRSNFRRQINYYCLQRKEVHSLQPLLPPTTKLSNHLHY